MCAEERIKVGKEDSRTSAFNQWYDKFQAKKGKAQTRHILDMSRRKVHDHNTQWHIIMIISRAIQNSPTKVLTYYLVSINLHPHLSLSFSDWIKKIVPAVRTGETAYSRSN